MKKLLLSFLSFLFFTTVLLGQFAEKSKNFEQYNGFFNFKYDANTDKIYLEVTDLEKEFLYVSSLSSGIGSTPSSSTLKTCFWICFCLFQLFFPIMVYH